LPASEPPIERISLHCGFGLPAIRGGPALAEKEAGAMRCSCGNEIKHVPEHLQGLANWVCQECTNAVPRNPSVGLASDEPIRKQMADARKQQAA